MARLKKFLISLEVCCTVVFLSGCLTRISDRGVAVNDIHSGLNATKVERILYPRSTQDIQEIVRHSKAEGRAISIAGGRHAMGGQQFASGAILIDMRSMNRVIHFDTDKGIVEVQAGIVWPDLVHYLIETQKGKSKQWGIVQKQTGADRLTIGGALSANAHGRGLKNKPIIDQVESFILVDANGELKTCSRTQNLELFRLAIGGYGLFGVMTQVTLRLAPRVQLERIVRIIDIQDLIPAFEQRINEGFVSGDFQYSTDRGSTDFLRKGIFPCYRPVEETRPIPPRQKRLTKKDWRELYYLSHVDPHKAFEKYSRYYLSTSGQLYWSDTHELGTYLKDYHAVLDRQQGNKSRASEMITEIYVPRDQLGAFTDDVRSDFLNYEVPVIYGTIRLIEKDEESFLAWARENFVCIIFNLHVDHSSQGIEQAKRHFQRLIDRAIQYKGSYYLTYHRWATREQIKRCYPQFPDFLKLKLKYDPEERFQSEWWRHYKEMFKEELTTSAKERRTDSE